MTEFDENFNAGDGTSSSSNKETTLPQDDDSDEVPIEVESLCMNCFKNGITKLKGLNIPFYKQGNFSHIEFKNMGAEHGQLTHWGYRRPSPLPSWKLLKGSCMKNRFRQKAARHKVPKTGCRPLPSRLPPKLASAVLNICNGHFMLIWILNL